LSLQELEGSKKLSAHATNVMYALTSVIDNLDDPECLTEMLIKLGQNHSRHRVTEKGFEVSRQSAGGGPGSSVSIQSAYGLDDRAIEIRSPAEAKGFFF
jgi:hypothetical protein